MGAAGLMWQQAAANTAQGALAIGMQRIGARYDRKQQLKTQEKMMGLQMKGEREMMDYQQQKQMEMWEKTGYGAQMEQMKKAGINPALMYGMGGGGGQTIGGGVPAVSGGSAAHVSTTPPMMGMDVAQLKMMQAQIDLIKAQENKTKTETTKIGGVDTQKTEVEIQDLTQGIQNKKAQEMLTQVQTDILQIEKEIKGKTKEDAITTIQHAALQQIDNARKALYEANVDEATWQKKIEMVETELTAMYLRNALTGEQITKTAQETIAIAEQLVQGWHKLNIDFANANTNRSKFLLDKYVSDVKDSTKLTVETIKGAVQAILLRGR